MKPALSVVPVLFSVTLAAAAVDPEPVVSVRDTGDGVYTVQALFVVAEPASVAWEVLTDYESIPRFMPDIRTSEVLDRHDGYARVEQDGISKFMFFSKRVHLVLDVDEGHRVIRFRDRCNKSFVHYEGSWILREQEGAREITYELTAQPAFSVPEFVLRKLFKRDARSMIERLRNEIASRALSAR